MKRDEIIECLSKCTNLVELVAKANELKRSGEKEVTVNRVVMELRKKMLKKASPIKRINRNMVPAISEERAGTIPFSIEQLNKPVVVYDGENILM